MLVLFGLVAFHYFYLNQFIQLCRSLLQVYVSVAVMAGLSVASVALVPPPHLPDLFPVLVSTTAFLHFLGTFLYFSIVQFSEAPGRKSQKKHN